MQKVKLNLKGEKVESPQGSHWITFESFTLLEPVSH
jgi:hypothetical protein